MRIADSSPEDGRDVDGWGPCATSRRRDIKVDWKRPLKVIALFTFVRFNYTQVAAAADEQRVN